MSRFIFIIVIILVPLLTMAQTSGGQIKRKQQPTTSATPQKNSSKTKPYSLKMTDSERETILNNLVKNMVFVEGGTFMMGATDEQWDKSGWAYPVHPVTLSSFYICKFETTQEVWIAVMGDNPSEFKGRKLPVTNVTYRDCQEFVKKLNQITGRSFRLPTEAEWEFAARGGNKSRGYKYAGSNTLSEVAWYRDGSGKTHNVGLKYPNELGLFDMSGNVSEWCNDIYDKYKAGEQVNPQGGLSGSHRIVRGGSIVSTGEDYCLTSTRDYLPEYDFRYYARGFRLAM